MIYRSFIKIMLYDMLHFWNAVGVIRRVYIGFSGKEATIDKVFYKVFLVLSTCRKFIKIPGPVQSNKSLTDVYFFKWSAWSDLQKLGYTWVIRGRSAFISDVDLS